MAKTFGIYQIKFDTYYKQAFWRDYGRYSDRNAVNEKLVDDFGTDVWEDINAYRFLVSRAVANAARKNVEAREIFVASRFLNVFNGYGNKAYSARPNEASLMRVVYAKEGKLPAEILFL